MAIGPLWIFYGFCSSAGNRLVQEWFDGLEGEVRDEIQDSLLYYEKVERNLWRRPGFDELGGEGISEFQFKAARKWYRIYGDYGPGRHEYTFLHGCNKKVGNDTAGKRAARERKKQLERKEASAYEFRWKECSDSSPTPRKTGA
jgi:hypothetical protein